MKIVIIILTILLLSCSKEEDINCGIISDTGITSYNNQWVTINNDKYIVYDTTLRIGKGDYICVKDSGNELFDLTINH